MLALNSKIIEVSTFKKSKLVTDYYRDHHESSQNEISKMTGISKGKVNKVLKKLKEEEQSSDVNSGTDIDTGSNSDNDNDGDGDNDIDSMTVTVTVTDHTKIASLKDAAASPPEEISELTYKQKI